MKNKNGFISMTLVYSFFIIFLFLMLAIINCYSEKNKFLEAINDKINTDIGATRSTKSTLVNKILADNIPLSIESVNLNEVANSAVGNGNGLFYVDNINITDENSDGYSGRMYFYRGSVDNNYVIFGSQFERDESKNIKPETVKQICWKIIRTNEDGSIRLLYSGLYDENKCASNGTIGNSAFNTSADDNAYVGYTYGSIGADNYNSTHYSLDNQASISSDIKKKIDNWIENKTNFYYASDLSYKISEEKDIDMQNNLLESSIFCNDRVVSENGYGNLATKYTENRVNGNPTYKCSNEYDRHSLSVFSGGSNANLNALAYSIGLLTADEVRMAGGAYGRNNGGYFLDYNVNYWTMTPYNFDTTANMTYVSPSGNISNKKVDELYSIVPVVSVKSKIIVQDGSGFIDDPYMLG